MLFFCKIVSVPTNKEKNILSKSILELIQLTKWYLGININDQWSIDIALSFQRQSTLAKLNVGRWELECVAVKWYLLYIYNSFDNIDVFINRYFRMTFERNGFRWSTSARWWWLTRTIAPAFQRWGSSFKWLTQIFLCWMWIFHRTI